MSIRIPVDRARIAPFRARWRVAELAFFGSVLRDDFRPDSDVDVLVRFAPGTHWSLFDLVRMQDELSEILGRRVDLADRRDVESSPNALRRRRILETAEVVDADGA